MFGAQQPQKPKWTCSSCLVGVALLIGLGVWFDGWIRKPLDAPRTASSLDASKHSDPVAKKWYEGGTLHDKMAADWQAATAEDKLATCGDFVAIAWQNKALDPSIQRKIQGVDDMKPIAQALVVLIDDGVKRASTDEKVRASLMNAKVSTLAAAGLTLMEAAAPE